MNEPCSRRDLVRNRKTQWIFWWLPIAAILLTGHFADREWILTVGWTASLLVMGSACIANARSCGRVHCYFTGPFFLLMALISLFHGLHVLPLGPRGWSHIGIALLLGSVSLCVVPEWLWGRYRGERRNSRPLA